MEASIVKTVVDATWEKAILVCGKCSNKLSGGFGPKGETKLAKALRKTVDDAGRGRKNRIGIVETKCLGVCPKGAVTVVDTSRPDRWRIVPQGRDVVEIARDLDLT